MTMKNGFVWHILAVAKGLYIILLLYNVMLPSDAGKTVLPSFDGNDYHHDKLASQLFNFV